MQLVVLGAGSFVGDMTFIRGTAATTRTATVAAMTPVTALRVSNAYFRRVVSSDVLARMKAETEVKDKLTEKTIADDQQVGCSRLMNTAFD